MPFYSYVKPPDDNATIWHYLNFARFMLLLDQHMFFFECADPQSVEAEGYGPIGHAVPWSAGSNTPMQTVMSSWHQHESVAATRWKKCLDHPIALRSTVAHLKMGLDLSSLDCVEIGTVNYQPPRFNLDEREVSVDVDYFYKRHQFECEHEIRVIGHVPGDHLDGGGITVPAVLETLVQGVCVAPSACPPFVNLVRNVLRKTDWRLCE